MSVNAIDSSYQNQMTAPSSTIGTEQEKPDGLSEINKLNAEIKQAESEIQETAKEVQEAMSDSTGGSSEKVQMLQNKMQMQQQTVIMKQVRIKEIESPSKSADQEASANTVTRPKFDRYVSGENASGKPDNVYRLEEKDGTRTIRFDRPEDLASTKQRLSTVATTQDS